MQKPARVLLMQGYLAARQHHRSIAANGHASSSFRTIPLVMPLQHGLMFWNGFQVCFASLARHCGSPCISGDKFRQALKVVQDRSKSAMEDPVFLAAYLLSYRCICHSISMSPHRYTFRFKGVGLSADQVLKATTWIKGKKIGLLGVTPLCVAYPSPSIPSPMLTHHWK